MCFQMSWSTKLAGELRVESFRNKEWYRVLVSSVLVFSKRQRKEERRFLVLGMVVRFLFKVRCEVKCRKGDSNVREYSARVKDREGMQQCGPSYMFVQGQRVGSGG